MPLLRGRLRINVLFIDYSVWTGVRASANLFALIPGQWSPRAEKEIKMTNTVKTLDKPANLPVITVPEAGRRYFGIGRSAAYDAARRKEIPTIKIGRKLLVPIAAVERMLAGIG